MINNNYHNHVNNRGLVYTQALQAFKVWDTRK